MKMTSSAVWALLALGAAWLGAPVCHAALGDSAECDKDWIPLLNEKCPDIFTDACHRFDACYSCGKHFNITKDACDKAFRADLRQTCKQDNHNQRHLQPHVSPMFQKPRYLLGKVMQHLLGKVMQHRAADQCNEKAGRLYNEVHGSVSGSDSPCSDHLCYNPNPEESECQDFLQNCMPDG